jgi:hypothetical protein
MTLNLNRTLCHFSNRLDVGMHFVKTGGFNGHIEFYDRMVARILPFRKRLIQQTQTDRNTYESFINLNKLTEFNDIEFLKKIQTICSENEILKSGQNISMNSIINEMFQFDLIVILPGQELPMHLNVPYFLGADRNTLPQWLLVTMKNSKLFDHLFIPQVQGIVWIDLEKEDKISKDTRQKDSVTNGAQYKDINGVGGDFYFYPYLPQLAKRHSRDSLNNLENEQLVKHSTKILEETNGVGNKNFIDQEEEDNEFYVQEKISYENLNKYIIKKSKHNSGILLEGAQVDPLFFNRYKLNL